MTDETKIFDELKAMVSPFSAYLDNLHLIFTTGSNQYRQQLEEGKADKVLTAFYDPEWDDCYWEYNPSTGIRRTVTSTMLDVEYEAHSHPETNTVEEMFDAWVIKALEKEKSKILASILELVNNSQSQHSAWTKLNFLADEVHSLKPQFQVDSSSYFTTSVVTHAKGVLNEIDSFIISKLPQSQGESGPQAANTFEYQGEDTDQLYDLYDRLQQGNRFIDGQKSRPSYFVNGFRGRITNPVVWSGTNDELRYFIVAILLLKIRGQEKPLIKTNRKRQWSVVNQLFITKEGTRFLDSLKFNNDATLESKRLIDRILAQFS